jgi:NAD+ synthetase
MSEGRNKGSEGGGSSNFADYAPVPTRGYISVPCAGTQNSNFANLLPMPTTSGAMDVSGKKASGMGYFEQFNWDIDHACFVASCIYGNPCHPNVKKLQQFRDRVLLKSWLGRKFIPGYYSGLGLRAALLIQKRLPWLLPILKMLFDWTIPKLPQGQQFTVSAIHPVPKEIFRLPWEQVVSQMKDFLENEAQKRDSDELMIPLSGGVDSCTVAALCRLTRLRVTALTVAADGFVRSEDVRDAKNFCAYFGISHEIANLSSVFRLIAASNFPDTNHLIMAFRNSVIKEFAEVRNAVLVDGANKTERYSGLYCRNSIIGDIFPLELFKTQVYQLAAFLGVPGYILEKPSHSGMEESKEDTFWGLGYQRFDWLAFLIERGDDFDSIVQSTGATIEILEAIQRQMKHAKVFFSFPDFQLKS